MKFTLFTLISVVCLMPTKISASSIISHSDSGQFDLEQRRASLKALESTILPLKEELQILEELAQFELGRFLLVNKGLNGFWTAYLINDAPQSELSNPLEKWVVTRAPAVLATQERFKIFQDQISKYVTKGHTVASIPCGRMDDLLTLSYKHQPSSLVGIDLDRDSVELAKTNAISCQKDHLVSFDQKDAWSLNREQEFDLITSNGLNIYEPSDEKVTELYKSFYKALKPNGILITSFLTPPPTISDESTWKDIDAEDLLKQKAVFVDVIGVKWQSFRTEKQTRQQLQDAGFEIIEFIYDRQGMFPTVVARRKG